SATHGPPGNLSHVCPGDRVCGPGQRRVWDHVPALRRGSGPMPFTPRLRLLRELLARWLPRPSPARRMTTQAGKGGTSGRPCVRGVDRLETREAAGSLLSLGSEGLAVPLLNPFPDPLAASSRPDAAGSDITLLSVVDRSPPSPAPALSPLVITGSTAAV